MALGSRANAVPGGVDGSAPALSSASGGQLLEALQLGLGQAWRATRRAGATFAIATTFGASGSKLEWQASGWPISGVAAAHSALRHQLAQFGRPANLPEGGSKVVQDRTPTYTETAFSSLAHGRDQL